MQRRLPETLPQPKHPRSLESGLPEGKEGHEGEKQFPLMYISPRITRTQEIPEHLQETLPPAVATEPHGASSVTFPHGNPS